MKKLTPAMQQYFDFQEQHKDAVLFFQMGDFFEMFGQQAVEVSRLLDVTLTARNKGSADELAMCGVPVKAATGYIAKLTSLGRKVAVCEQVTKPDGKGVVERAVTKIITPGTTFDEELLDRKTANYLCAVEAGKNEYGLALVDVTTGRFQAGLFSDYQGLLEEIRRIGPSELLMSGEENVAEAVDGIFVAPFSLPSWKKPAEVIAEHFKVKGLETFGLERSETLQRAVAAVLLYLQDTQRSELGHITAIEQYQTGDTMLLDGATVRNLELFFNQQTALPEGALISVIDETVTSMGARLLRWWLAHPLTDAAKIAERQKAVAYFVGKNEAREQFRQALRSICDLERLVGKLGTMRANPRDLHNLKESLLHIPALKTILSPAKKEVLLTRLDQQIDLHEELVALIGKTLSDDPPVLMQEGGYIRDGFHAELDELRKLAASGKNWINDLQEQERERTGITSLKIKFNKVFGYYIEVSKANLASIPDNYIRKQTLVNAERYITPELKEYEEKVLGAQDKMLLLEEELFTRLRQEVFAFVAALQKTARAIAEADVLSSLAELAVKRGYCRPEITEGNILEIQQGRHPVIEAIGKGQYIPNDLFMNDESSYQLLTGPNMSGKSSYLRQNALIVLLAQMGGFVPAENMKWSIVDRVFTRVGASDNLAKGRSTFMVEMQEAAYILHNATEKSLVILDELGRGTSTYDGLSLAWAISEYLHDITKAKTLFATHYHELIEVVEQFARGRNFSVVVAEDGEDVVFLHQVQEGGVSRSYGIEVAKLAGMPRGLVLRAKDLLAKLEQHAWEKDQMKSQPSLPLMPISKPTEHAVIQRLKEIDPNKLTPMDALRVLDELKGEVE